MVKLASSVVAIALLIPLSACGSGEQQKNPGVLAQGLVIYGPSHSISDHIDAGTSAWGEGYAIVVAVATSASDCVVRPEGDSHSGDTTYCDVRMRPTLILRPGLLDLQARGHQSEFILHYWFPSDGEFVVQEGVEYLAFLAPTHVQGTYSPSAIIEASGELISLVRKRLEL